MEDKIKGQRYAIKAVKTVLMAKEDKVHQLKRERQILNSIDHPNIIKLHFTCASKDKLYFGLEYAPNGDLAKLLKVIGTLPFDLARYYTTEIVNGLEYLKSKGIAHRDIKPENILLDENFDLKITDFGTAKSMNMPPDECYRQEDYGTTFVGSPEYVSPEVLSSEESGPASDLWALGCIIYKFFTGITPFYRKSTFLMFQAILEANPSYPSNMNPHVKDLCKKLLVVDPGKRLGNTSDIYKELKSHPFFEGIDFNNLVKVKALVTNEIREKLAKEKVDTVMDSYSSDDESRPNKKSIRKYIPVKQGTVQMKSGWIFYRNKDLILNNKPRLLYFSSKTKEFESDIILTRNTVAVKRGDKDFDVVTYNMTFKFKGETEEDARGWVEAINNSIQNLNYQIFH